MAWFALSSGGSAAVWGGCGREVFTEEWELEGHDAVHIDFLTDDIAIFLEKVLAAVAAQ